jgi:S1-C subfamily serine protease
MKIGGIRPGGPAEKAGLEPGDVIVGMKGKKILNIYDYMGILGELKAGDVVELDIVRGTDRKTFTATMQPRQ